MKDVMVSSLGLSHFKEAMRASCEQKKHVKLAITRERGAKKKVTEHQRKEAEEGKENDPILEKRSLSESCNSRVRVLYEVYFEFYNSLVCVWNKSRLESIMELVQ
jgi:hypothetical protein